MLVAISDAPLSDSDGFDVPSLSGSAAGIDLCGLILTLADPDRLLGGGSTSKDAVLLRLESVAIATAVRDNRAGSGGAGPPVLLGITTGGGEASVRVRVCIHRRIAQELRHALAAATVHAIQAAAGCRCMVARLDSLHSVLLSYSSVAAVANTPFGGLVLQPHRAVGLQKVPLSLASADVQTPRCPKAMSLALFGALMERYNASQVAAILAVASGGAFRVPGADVGRGGVLRSQPTARNAEVTLLIGPPGTGWRHERKVAVVCVCVCVWRGHAIENVNGPPLFCLACRQASRTPF